MGGMADSYARSMHKHFKTYYANWPPGNPVKLGDYGYLDDAVFIRQGSLAGLIRGFSVTPRDDTTKDQEEFKSEGVGTVKLWGKGEMVVNGVANVKPIVEIGFKGKNAVYFNAADCTYQSVEEMAELEAALRELRNAGKWDMGWCVVGGLMKAAATTILISMGSEAGCVLEAAAECERIDLADASIGLKVKQEQAIAHKDVAKKGMVPLLSLWKLGWFSDKIKPKARGLTDAAIPEGELRLMRL